jgi:hypothetical protein
LLTYAHAIVALEAVQLVHVVGSETRARFDLASSRVQFDAAARAVEVIAVIDLTTEAQRSAVDQPMALVARILSNLGCLDAGIAAMAQSAIVVLDEPRIGQFLRTELAAEAIGVPGGLHRLNDTSDDNVTALVAVWSEENTEILLAVLAALKLVENSVLKCSEALGAPKSEVIDE